jgi:predicted CXXCH cytochrome family protein
LIPPTGPRPAGAAAAVRSALAAGLVIAATALVWAGCTVTARNYKTLSFFFDGVPDPSATSAAGSLVGARTPEHVVVHRPYGEERCAECHKGRTRPTKNDSGLCLQCHAGVTSEHERMHGPVAAVACLWCHTPHESRYASLLRGPDRTICAQCHTPSMLNVERVPEHADVSRACLECHVGHGSAAPYLLRTAAPTPATEAPAPPPQLQPPGPTGNT